MLIRFLASSSLLWRIALSHDPNSTLQMCKCLPSDACWPSQEEWRQLNTTVGGRLIKTVPLGSPCHDPVYNADECALLKEQWLYSGVHMESSSSVMAPLFANQSCDPFQPREKPCTLGNYVAYSVNASNADHIIATLKFADKKNIRFVIRNTGHDYLGRSTGAGALAIWTHHLKDVKILDWRDNDFRGKALKVGAGVQGFEALAAAKEAGLVVVTGECPTVGLAGGYIQGGGHSALSTKFGLAADNALSYDVVTATGELVTASGTEHQDLYWALSGGGGGNYGVVVSMTVRAHPDATTAGAAFMISGSEQNPEQIFDVIDAWHAALPKIVDSGVMAIYFFSNTFLQIPALTAYNKTASDIPHILEPFRNSLIAMNISFNPTVTQFSSYVDHYNKYWGPLPSGNIQVGTQLFGGRLIPRSILPSFSPTARKLANLGVIFIGVGLNVSHFGTSPPNAVLPQWRSSITQASLTLPWNFSASWEDMLDTQRKITEEVQPVIEAATAGAGAYMNEADFQQRGWQEVFFGRNYERLLRIKRRYDPKGLFFAEVAVGSEEWSVGSDGKMCRAGKLGVRGRRGLGEL
ncbi:FAD-binding domain-containing protein [Lindgomyces ingoldianus]|uniref:FAD-binding domain-containing protein n=1 Tax=Lindgomyces ingoldianus TaxID=673940 RepID=A0ACB6Q725_9PLEO|nr:FAD-binding domain-containing protein [Lindgomyces ingoldianus]KAF2462749.1 FAD-binding domain-containing protein [Lindgomyces ingoldianus]